MGIISEIFGYPLGWIMWLIYKVVNNYAWSIVIFTIITKVLLMPLSIKQQKSTAAMGALNPKIERLKKQYAKNPEKLQEEQMKLYNEEGVNPMTSCLPMLIQFPILYGIFDVVYRPIHYIFRINKDIITSAKDILVGLFESNPALAESLVGKQTNLTARPEIYIVKAVRENPELFSDAQFTELVDKVKGFSYDLFGIVDFGSIPTLKPETWNAAAFILILIPILSGVFQLIYTVYSQIHQKKINPSTATAPGMGGMNIMLYGMPIFSIWIAFKFPLGIGFYWTMSSLFSLVQQVILNKIYTPEYVEKLVEKDKIKNKNKKKSAIMQRYEAMVKEAQATQASQNGGSRPRTIASSLSEDEDSDSGEIKLSKSKQKEYERMLIREARRRQAEKYGDEFIDDEDDSNKK